MKKKGKMNELKRKWRKTYFGRRALALGFDFLIIAVLSVVFYIVLFAVLAFLIPPIDNHGQI